MSYTVTIVLRSISPHKDDYNVDLYNGKVDRITPPPCCGCHYLRGFLPAPLGFAQDFTTDIEAPK